MNRTNRNRIPEEVLKDIFPKKLSRSQPSDRVYAKLKSLILSGKLKEEQRLVQHKLARNLNVSIPSIYPVFQQLKRDGLMINRGRKESFVA
jgi:DNA-binding GntR family transcriptional regulator